MLVQQTPYQLSHLPRLLFSILPSSKGLLQAGEAGRAHNSLGMGGRMRLRQEEEELKTSLPTAKTLSRKGGAEHGGDPSTKSWRQENQKFKASLSFMKPCT